MPQEPSTDSAEGARPVVHAKPPNRAQPPTVRHSGIGGQTGRRQSRLTGVEQPEAHSSELDGVTSPTQRGRQLDGYLDNSFLTSAICRLEAHLGAVEAQERLLLIADGNAEHLSPA